MSEKTQRRDFLQKSLRIGSGLLIAPALLSACQSGSGGESGSGADDRDVTDCSDLSRVSAEEIKKREGLGYVEKSPMPEEHCKNCQLYIPPRDGESCGGCVLFKGPVFEEGYCTYWAPII